MGAAGKPEISRAAGHRDSGLDRRKDCPQA
jgi:hypothetical protein